jgi:hypothetical protein
MYVPFLNAIASNIISKIISSLFYRLNAIRFNQLECNNNGIIFHEKETRLLMYMIYLIPHDLQTIIYNGYS